MKSISLSTILLAFGVGLCGTLVAILVKQGWADRYVPPAAMPSVYESLYPNELKSVLEIGARFPDEVYVNIGGEEQPFYELFRSGPTVLLFWSPMCPPCHDQAVLWDSVMVPALLPGIKEVVCLPRHYKDSIGNHLLVFGDRKVVFVDERRFDSLYHLVVVPMIIAVDRQGFLCAIQYEYSQFFTEDLIECVTRYEVGPCVPVVSLKGDS